MDGSGQEQKQWDQLGLFAMVLVRDHVCMKGQRGEGERFQVLTGLADEADV